MICMAERGFEFIGLHCSINHYWLAFDEHELLYISINEEGTVSFDTGLQEATCCKERKVQGKPTLHQPFFIFLLGHVFEYHLRLLGSEVMKEMWKYS